MLKSGQGSDRTAHSQTALGAQGSDRTAHSQTALGAVWSDPQTALGAVWSEPKTIGVLALQGDFEAHRKALERAGARAVEVRTAAELEAVDGLVIPGGESTTMLKLLDGEKLFEPLRRFGAARPIFGTCAGAILLASDVSRPPQASLALMDIGVERNAYGRQLDSHVARVEPEEEFARRIGDGPLETVFIRAPIIRRSGCGVTVLARYHGDPVLVEQGMHMAATFHPELSSDIRVHRLFLSKVAGSEPRP